MGGNSTMGDFSGEFFKKQPPKIPLLPCPVPIGERSKLYRIKMIKSDNVFTQFYIVFLPVVLRINK